jgi:hypothetical protein
MGCGNSSEFSHYHGASLDYGFQWDLETSEFLVTSDWTIATSSDPSPTDVTLSDDSMTTDTTSIFVTGGTSGVVYYLTNVITTSSNPPRKDGQVIILSCQ